MYFFEIKIGLTGRSYRIARVKIFKNAGIDTVTGYTMVHNQICPRSFFVFAKFILEPVALVDHHDYKLAERNFKLAVSCDRLMNKYEE